MTNEELIVELSRVTRYPYPPGETNWGRICTTLLPLLADALEKTQEALDCSHLHAEHLVQSLRWYEDDIASLKRRLEEKDEAALDAEQARWQQRIDKILSPYNVDGSGTDSGDPLDLTECEIRQALNEQQEKIDGLKRRLEEAERANAELLDRLKVENFCLSRKVISRKRQLEEMQEVNAELLTRLTCNESERLTLKRQLEERSYPASPSAPKAR